MRELEKDDHGIAEAPGGIFVDGLYVPPIGFFGFRNIGDVWKHDPEDCTIGSCTSCRVPSMHQPNKGESMSEYRESDEKGFMGYDESEPQENDHNVDGDNDPTVDSRPAAPIEDSRPNTGTDTSEFGLDENVEEGGEMNHMDNSGEVIGRLNKDLPTENLSVPDATS